jgi:predicted TIM-barrel fold metal-dependent hydrolase
MSASSRPSRREILAGAAALAVAPSALAAAPAPERPRFTARVDVDVHCHSFCSLDLPIVGFVAHHIPGLPDITRELTRWPELMVRAVVRTVARLPNAIAPAGADELAGLRRALEAPGGGGTVAPAPTLPPGAADDLVAEIARVLPFSLGTDMRALIGRHLDTLYLVAHARAAITASLVAAYPSVTLFTPSLVDYDAWSEDRAPTPLATQVEIHKAIARLAARGRVGRPDARVHPFVAFDPKREVKEGGALELVRQAVDGAGFVGVKLYPPVGFAPLENATLRPREPFGPRLDVALRALYATCETEEIPITAHASAGNEFALGYRDLCAPDRWAPVLRAYPTLRLNFGHFGHDYGADGPQGVKAAGAWIRQAARLMQAHPNVYADLSSSPMAFDQAYTARFLDYLAAITAEFPKVKRRLMYGSDWWLSRLEPGAAGVIETVRGALAQRFPDDEVADVMGRNALRFLGFLDEDDRPRAGRAARRLRAFYGDAPHPSWLA